MTRIRNENLREELRRWAMGIPIDDTTPFNDEVRQIHDDMAREAMGELCSWAVDDLETNNGT